MKIYNRAQIAEIINFERDFEELMKLQKKAFIEYSVGRIVAPTPLQISFKEPRGDCHIKVGYKVGDEFFVIKMASGFYECASGDGLMVITSQKSGKIEAIMHDEGWLTQIRTAVAACIVAELTPFDVEQIGIIGTGKQAEICLQFLAMLYPKKKFILWGRNWEKAFSLANKMKSLETKVVESIEEMLSEVQVLITATASHEPLISASLINTKIHIIALGADEKGKQELDPGIFENAGIVLADSIRQTSEFGEISYAIESGIIQGEGIVELGEILQKGTSNFEKGDIMISDLTGIAAQDAFIALWAYERLSRKCIQFLST